MKSPANEHGHELLSTGSMEIKRERPLRKSDIEKETIHAILRYTQVRRLQCADLGMPSLVYRYVNFG